MKKLYERYVIACGEVYKVIEKNHKDMDDDIFNTHDNGDGTIDYEVMYYNGGCGFNEAIEYALEDKNCYVPIWKDVDKELPECEGIYYGKKDDTNSMWKVIFRNNEWYLSGYPEHKIDVIKWTELY